MIYLSFIFNNFKEQKAMFLLIVVIFLISFKLFAHPQVFYTIMGCLLATFVEIFLIKPIIVLKQEKDYLNFTEDIIYEIRLIVFQLFILTYGIEKGPIANASFLENISELADIKKDYPQIYTLDLEKINLIKRTFNFFSKRMPNLKNYLTNIPTEIRIATQRIVILNGIINNIEVINTIIAEMDTIQDNIEKSLQDLKEINFHSLNLIDNLILYFSNTQKDKLLQAIYNPQKQHLYFKKELQ